MELQLTQDKTGKIKVHRVIRNNGKLEVHVEPILEAENEKEFVKIIDAINRACWKPIYKSP